MNVYFMDGRTVTVLRRPKTTLGDYKPPIVSLWCKLHGVVFFGHIDKSFWI